MTTDITTQTDSLLQVIAKAAVDEKVDADKLHRLIDAQERIMAFNARAAFNSDFAAMQPELPVIETNGEILLKGQRPGEGQKYAKFEDIQDAIRPVLANHGFAISFRNGYEGENVLITTILTHRNGHTEQTTMLLPRDMSGSKNQTQAVGSSLSYGYRYGVRALLNLRYAGEDDDGKAAHQKTITPVQREALVKLLGGPGERVGAFCKHYGLNTLDELAAESFDTAVAQIKRANAKA